jgi:uncharacterized peroxidase-related enzyme
MAHIALPEGIPGISAALTFRPETARPLMDLAQTLLRGPSSLTPGERELIAAYVSHLNDCAFCSRSHSGAAACLLDDEDLVERVKADFESTEIDAKMKSLLAIAAKVSQSGRAVEEEDIQRARECGATDMEIHDAVLVAAAFCMYNRYVDGLGAWTPDDPALYRVMGQRLAEQGYGRKRE